MNAKQTFDWMLSEIEQHEQMMGETISLIASENVMSPNVERALTSDMGNRVAEGWIDGRYFPGIEYYDAIEKQAMKDLAKMFSADFVDPRPLSGTMANMIVYSAFTEPGDTIMTLSIPSGAHVSMAGSAPKKVFHLKVEHLEINQETFEIDIKRSIAKINNIKPKLLILGGSVLLFQQPIRQLSAVVHKYGGIVLFDASHVAGLIAGGVHKNPLLQGADIMTMTTCKTIPGPQHAFIFSKRPFSEPIKKTTFPAFVSGHHLHETVSAFLACEEFRIFGKAYIKQVVKNAQHLARCLSKHGFNILAEQAGFTETHMFLMDISDVMTATEAVKILASVHILTNKNLLPGDKLGSERGLRFGTQEITRRGAKEKDMEKIAELITDSLRRRVSTKATRSAVAQLRRSLSTLKYC